MTVIVNQISELPEGELLTGKGGIFELPPSQHNMVAALRPELEDKACWLLQTEDGQKSSLSLQMRKQLRDRGYEIQNLVIVSEGILRALYEKASHAADEKEATGSLQESHVVKKFLTIMVQVFKDGASDIHIEKRQDYASIKIRKNGEIVKLPGYETMSPADATSLVTVVYNVLAEADSKDVAFNETLIQQGAVKMNLPIDGFIQEIKLRFQSFPVYPNGFDCVMRVLVVNKNEKFTTLEELGYEPSQIKLILESVSRAVGAVVIAGVTGSGKSTTLKNLLMWVNEDREFSEKVYTVEDPPEYVIPHVSQIPVARRKDDETGGGKMFEDAIKACMRADPDVIMVGEIRDKSTGDLLKKAVQSGHRVLTTVHASSPLGVVDRLMDFGLSSSTLSSQEFIAGLMYQRLLAKLCPHCSQSLTDIVSSAKAPKHLLELNRRIERALIQGKEDPSLYLPKVRLRGDGCPRCKKGVTGRTVCAEVVKPDLTILECFQRNDLLSALRYLRDKVSDKSLTSRNMVGKSSMAHAFMKMLHGEIDPIELERSFGIISIDEIRGLPELNSDDYKEDDFLF